MRYWTEYIYTTDKQTTYNSAEISINQRKIKFRIYHSHKKRNINSPGIRGYMQIRQIVIRESHVLEWLIYTSLII